LRAGQKVVSSGQFLIDSEASLKTTLNRLQATPDAAIEVKPGAAKRLQPTGTGKVNQIDAREGTLEISHGPIPALKWPAMTMMFRTADKAQLNGIKAGDEIEFEMQGEPNKEGDYLITRIARKSAKAAK
jgi:Cu(I)/Ag(I) efflux system membrane fusion protein